MRRGQGRERGPAPGEQHVPAQEPRRLGARRSHRTGHHHTVPGGQRRRRRRVQGRRGRVLRRDGTAGRPRRAGQQGEHVHRAHHDVPVHVQRQRAAHPVVTAASPFAQERPLQHPP